LTALAAGYVLYWIRWRFTVKYSIFEFEYFFGTNTEDPTIVFQWVGFHQSCGKAICLSPPSRLQKNTFIRISNRKGKISPISFVSSPLIDRTIDKIPFDLIRSSKIVVVFFCQLRLQFWNTIGKEKPWLKQN